MREYEVDGIHFDEVGFGMPWQSLCERCRKAFAADTGAAVTDWPNDVIRVAKVTRTNALDLAAWRGPQLDAFVGWRCGRVTQYLRRLCEAARSVRPVAVSYAAMPEPSANRVFYGEDLAELGKVFDFIVPMSYYTQYGMGARPEWTAETCQALAAWVHQGNPQCRVYAGISAYGADGGWFESVRALYDKLVAAGAVTTDQRREHLQHRTCKQGFESLEWLHGEGKIDQAEYDRVKAILDARTPTSDELVRAVASVRQAHLPGFVFFRYECMFEDRTQGVIDLVQSPRDEVVAVGLPGVGGKKLRLAAVRRDTPQPPLELAGQTEVRVAFPGPVRPDGPQTLVRGEEEPVGQRWRRFGRSGMNDEQSTAYAGQQRCLHGATLPATAVVRSAVGGAR